MIEFQCPKCGKQLKVKSDYAGRTGSCSGCKAKVLVPAMEDVFVAEIVEDNELATELDYFTEIEPSSVVPYRNYGVQRTEPQPMSEQEDLAKRWSKWQAENPQRPRWHIWGLYTAAIIEILASIIGLTLLFLGVSLSPTQDVPTSNVIHATIEEGAKGIGPAGNAFKILQFALLIFGILSFLQALKWDGKLNLYERLENVKFDGRKLAIGVGVCWVILVLVLVLSFVFQK